MTNITIERTSDEVVRSAIHWCVQNKSAEIKVWCRKLDSQLSLACRQDITIWKKSSANYIIKRLNSDKFITFVFASSDDACLFVLQYGRV